MASTETIWRVPSHVLEKSFTYDEYRDLTEKLLAEGKTTGENHSESMLHYTKINLFRMKRLDKTSSLDSRLEEALGRLDRKLFWLVLTEAWCGDAAQNLPIINKMVQATPNIEMRLILRDENLDIMDQFLTDGKSRSIPKLISLDAETHELLGTWGPRPATVQKLYKELSSQPDFNYPEAAERIHKWYADNKNEEIQQEFLELLEKWSGA